MNLPPVGSLGGRERSVIRHLREEGPLSVGALVDHFVDGRHEWLAEDLDRALTSLTEAGHVELDEWGFYGMTVRPPL